MSMYLVIWLVISYIYLFVHTLSNTMKLLSEEEVPWYDIALCTIGWTLLILWLSELQL